MSRTAAIIFTLVLASAAMAQTPQPSGAPGNQANVPWAVSVVHAIDVQKMVAQMREQQKMRVGVAGTAPPYIYHITTGIIVDGQGHVVTRLANLDPQDKEHKLTVTTSNGTTLAAKLIGVDFATGFAVLEVALLKATAPKIAVAGNLLNGAPVKILSSDVVARSVTDKVYLAPSIAVSEGQVTPGSLYAKARGALTLRSDSLLARSDSGVVVTPENLVVGIAQWAGYGRAYLYPLDFVRDTIAKRVIEKNDNVPAGWLGVDARSLSDLPDADLADLGFQRRAGVIIQRVVPESPAAQAGIVTGDVITRVDDFDVAGTADLGALLGSLPAGQSIKLRAMRNRQPVEINAVLGPKPNAEARLFMGPFPSGLQPELSEREQLQKRFEELAAVMRSYQKSPPSRETIEARRELELEIRRIQDEIRALGPEPATVARNPQPAAPPEYPSPNLTGETVIREISFPAGFTARELTPQLAASFHVTGGVLVSKVAKGSAAELGGLKVGDVILGAQERSVLNIAQLQSLFAAQKGTLVLKVVRTKEPIVVSLNLQ